MMPDEFLMFNKATYREELRTGNGDERSKSWNEKSLKIFVYDVINFKKVGF